MPTTPDPLRGLHEAHETYRYLVEGIPAILYLDAGDDPSTNLYMSPQVQDVLGISPSEWRRDPGSWADRLHPDDRDRVVAERRECNRTGDPFRAEYRLLASDGRVVWIRDDAELVRDDDGSPAFWRGVMVDVTERRVVEERLRHSLDALRATMDDRRRLLMRLEEAQDGERRRIAADIHDDSIQVMTAADLQVQGLLERLEDPELRSELAGLRGMLQDAVERLRHLLFELRPPSLEREGIVSALRSYTSALPGPEVAVRATLEASRRRTSAPCCSASRRRRSRTPANTPERRTSKSRSNRTTTGSGSAFATTATGSISRSSTTRLPATSGSAR